ncbi:hypothetical protein Droror1_Dr00006475 [Drosera rotundifolia]
MGRQSKARNQENKIGNGKVTASQVAFIVDRYLYDNKYNESRAVFRSEASSLLPNSTLHGVPRGLLTLGAMLDEYIQLKEQKVMMEQERARLEQETVRVQALLLGMQNVMDVYNSGAMTGSVPPVAQPTTTAECLQITPAMATTPISGISNKKPSKLLAPSTSCPPRKRKNCKIITDETLATKKSCTPLVSCELSGKDPIVVSTSTDLAHVWANCPQTSASLQIPGNNQVCDGSLAAKPSAAKSLLFTESAQSPKSGSSGPSTPSRAASSQSDKSISPLDETTPEESRPTSCTTINISSKTIFVSPCKQSSILSIERNQCTFSSPMRTNSEKQSIRCHVKGRLDFNGSDPPTSPNTNNEGHSSSVMNHDDIFDMDLPNLDSFGPNFSLSDLLKDFDIGEMDCSFQSSLGASTDAISILPCDPTADGSGIHPDFIQKSSSATEVHVGKGTDSFTTMRSITKRVQFSSPAKTPRKTRDAEK